MALFQFLIHTVVHTAEFLSCGVISGHLLGSRTKVSQGTGLGQTVPCKSIPETSVKENQLPVTHMDACTVMRHMGKGPHGEMPRPCWLKMSLWCDRP